MLVVYFQSMNNQSICLTIAGSDPSGGAGIQADLKAFSKFNTFGMAVITALTAQNTLGVTGVHEVPVGFVVNQIETIYNDKPVPQYIKTGMLASAGIVNGVSNYFKETRDITLIIDPVMVSTSGSLLLHADAVQAYRCNLIPLAFLVTPNNHEAEVLTGQKVQSIQDAEIAAELIYKMGPKNVLVKGGDYGQNDSTTTDVLYDGKDITHFTHPRILSTSTHGTGCTLSASICALLSRGFELKESIEMAREYVFQAILTAPGYGVGNGPTNHFAKTKFDDKYKVF